MRRTALIFNPIAGRKRYLFSFFRQRPLSFDAIKKTLTQYEMFPDYYQTKAPLHATALAHQLSQEGYSHIIVVGGDGTISEVAQGLVGTKTTLAIIPTGSFINIPRILGIPEDIHQAITLIQKGDTHKIDMGKVSVLSGRVLDHPHYFLESVSIGLEAQLQERFKQLEEGDMRALYKIFRTWIDYYLYRVTVKLKDNKVLHTRVSIITASNAPYIGASIPIAPKAELTDHKLTVRLFRMSRRDLLLYFVTLMYFQKESRRIQTIQTEEVTIESKIPRLVQIDARIFGTTPVTCSIVPHALNVICKLPTTSLHKHQPD